jgi:hypothetical protein
MQVNETSVFKVNARVLPPTLFQKMQNYQSEGRRKEILIKCKKSYTKLHRGAGALAPVLAFIYIIFKAP